MNSSIAQCIYVQRHFLRLPLLFLLSNEPPLPTFVSKLGALSSFLYTSTLQAEKKACTYFIIFIRLSRAVSFSFSVSFPLSFGGLLKAVHLLQLFCLYFIRFIQLLSSPSSHFLTSFSFIIIGIITEKGYLDVIAGVQVTANLLKYPKVFFPRFLLVLKLR